MSRLKVYYNSACPVCDAGIGWQRRKTEACNLPVEWIDVHRVPEAVREIGAECEFVKERLHVVDGEGRLRIGADAFHALWSRTRGQRGLAALVAIPGIDWLYNVYARLLYRWNRANHRW